MVKKLGHTDIAVVIDRSGSMESIRQAVIDGYNSFIQEQKTVPGTANVTLTFFNQKSNAYNSNPYLNDVNKDIEVAFSDEDIRKVGRLNKRLYAPSGGTPLWDAIGVTLDTMETKVRSADDKVVVLIITDGMENASTKYTSYQIRQKIELLKKAGWQFVFTAANIDTFAVGGSIGINLNSMASFTPDYFGYTSNMSNTSIALNNFRIGTTSEVSLSNPLLDNDVTVSSK